MKLATSTGDFGWYVDSVPEKVKCFKNSKFKYINLELSGKPIGAAEEYDWRKYADELGEAAAYAGVEYVVAHAPCLHFTHLNALNNPDDENYQADIRAIRYAIEICNILGIKRIVVHACVSMENPFSIDTFYKYNTMFYREFFDLMEKYGITVMTENWDNSRSNFSTGKQIRDFLDYVNHPLLAACWDTAHGNIDKTAREIGQYQNIVEIGNKLEGMHISDNFGDVHHHSWPFAGIINFDSVVQGLLDVNYDGYFTFEASYSLLHSKNWPYQRKPWIYQGEPVTRLLNPSLELKKQAVYLLYETGNYILSEYNCFER